MDLDSRQLLSLIAIVLTVVGVIPYIFDILRHKTKPHGFTWLVFATVTGIAFFAQYSDRGGAGSWPTGFTAFACLLIAILSVKYGERGITRFDWCCLSLSLLAVPLWQLTATPLYSVILVSLIDVTGFLPTFRKSWHRPGQETLSAYNIGSLKFLLAIFALENYTLTTLLYPIVVILINSTFVVMCSLRKRAIANTLSS